MSFYGIYLGYGDTVEIFAPTREYAIKNFNDAEFYYSDLEPHKLQYTFYRFDEDYARIDKSIRMYVDKTLMEFLEV